MPDRIVPPLGELATDSVIGRHSCGCITYWRGYSHDPLDAKDQREMGRMIAEGMTVEHVRLDDIRTDPNFMPGKCPHKPTGWKREEPTKHKWTVRVESRYGNNPVYVRCPFFGARRRGGGLMVGFIHRGDDGWLATEGWFDRDGHGSRQRTANNGAGDDRQAVPVHGPFPTKKAALAFMQAVGARRSREIWLSYGHSEKDADRMQKEWEPMPPMPEGTEMPDAAVR